MSFRLVDQFCGGALKLAVRSDQLIKILIANFVSRSFTNLCDIVVSFLID